MNSTTATATAAPAFIIGQTVTARPRKSCGIATGGLATITGFTPRGTHAQLVWADGMIGQRHLDDLSPVAE